MPVRASADPAELGVQDLVVVAVKAPAMAEVAQAIAPLLGPDTIVLTAMNGVPWWFFEGFGGRMPARACKAVDRDGASRGPSRRSTSSAAWCMPAARSTRPAWCGITSATS